MATEPQILSSFSPRACPRCILTCFLSLPPMLAYLLFCRGPGILPPPSTSVENPLQINPFYAKQTQFPKDQNERKLNNNKGI